MSKLAVGSIEGLASEGYKITVPAGSKIVQAGAVLQVVSTTKTDTWSASNSGGGDFDVTGLSATITPTSTSSKILILATVSKGTYGGVVVKRGTTTLAVGDSSGSRTVVMQSGMNGAAGSPIPISINHLDSPNTTSATTYKISIRDNHWSVATTMYVNRSDADANQIYDYRTTSVITLLEIAG